MKKKRRKISMRGLGHELAKLEHTNPEVRAAAEKYDRTVRKLVLAADLVTDAYESCARIAERFLSKPATSFMDLIRNGTALMIAQAIRGKAELRRSVKPTFKAGKR